MATAAIAAVAGALPTVIDVLGQVTDLAKKFGPPAIEKAEAFIAEIGKTIDNVKDGLANLGHMSAEETLAALAAMQADLAKAREELLASQGPTPE